MTAMGLGGAPREWDDYEWFALADEPARAALTSVGDEPLTVALLRWLEENPVWGPRGGGRGLLAALDNLRADPRRWRARMAVMVALAREADDVALAGQVGAVRRARPYLAELADRARSVADGSDLADHVLLDAADRVPAGRVQIAVVANQGIFAAPAERGRLTVVSPGADALSERLRHAASRLLDLAALEEQLREGSPARAVPVPRSDLAAPASLDVSGRAPRIGGSEPDPADGDASTPRAQRATTRKTAAKKTPATKKPAKKSAAAG